MLNDKIVEGTLTDYHSIYVMNAENMFKFLAQVGELDESSK